MSEFNQILDTTGSAHDYSAEVKEISKRYSVNTTSTKDTYKGFEVTSTDEIVFNNPLLYLNNQPLITKGEIFVQVALPGTGKTQTCAAIAAAFVAQAHNLTCDSLGFGFSSCTGSVLYIDTERHKQDNQVTYEGIKKRLVNPPLSDQKISKLDYWGLSEISDYKEMRLSIERHIQEGQFDAVIIDGALDLSPALNDEVAAKETVIWMRSLAVKHDLGIITTLHPNKGTETAAGHIGGFLYRWCRAMLLIRSCEADKSVREITVDFVQGKLSHDDPGRFESHYFMWDSEKHMMVSTDEPEANEDKAYSEIILLEILDKYRKQGQKEVPAKILCDGYGGRMGIGYEAARKHVQQASQDEKIRKTGKGKNTRYSSTIPF